MCLIDSLDFMVCMNSMTYLVHIAGMAFRSCLAIVAVCVIVGFFTFVGDDL